MKEVFLSVHVVSDRGVLELYRTQCDTRVLFATVVFHGSSGMPYFLEIIVKVLLNRHGGMPTAIVTQICECLQRPHHSSFLSVRWKLPPGLGAEPWRLGLGSVLETGLWLRYHGFSEANSDYFQDVVLSDSPEVQFQKIVLRKATRLAFAVMLIGLKAPNYPFTRGNVVDNNLELLRLLCQGPWPKSRDRIEHRRRSVELVCQLKVCFRMLVDDASFRSGNGSDLYPRGRSIRLDLCMLQTVFVKAFEVLSWKGGPVSCRVTDSTGYAYTNSRPDFSIPRYFDTTPTGAPRLSDASADKYYTKMFEGLRILA